MKTSELQLPELDYWVARAEGFERCEVRPGSQAGDSYPWKPFCAIYRQDKAWLRYSPSTDWSQGGPIKERERIICIPWFLEDYGNWAAIQSDQGTNIYDLGPWDFKYWGETPLIAAMRAYVASKFGEEVEEA